MYSEEHWYRYVFHCTCEYIIYFKLHSRKKFACSVLQYFHTKFFFFMILFYRKVRSERLFHIKKWFIRLKLNVFIIQYSLNYWIFTSFNIAAFIRNGVWYDDCFIFIWIFVCIMKQFTRMNSCAETYQSGHKRKML